MATLTRTDLLARAQAAIAALPRESHTIPELGGSVLVRGMNAKERDRVLDRARITKGRRKGEIDNALFRAQVLLLCVIDEAGSPLLQPSDVDVLTDLSPGVIDGLMAAINRLSGFTAEEEEALGNASASGAASDGSASASPSN